MSRKFPQALFALLFTVLMTGPLFATNYYVAANGSDSNNGTSQTTPWAHLPGMATWTGTHTPTGGDTFILRGCDVWPNASFPIQWKWSGTSANPITIDRDTTWYNTTNCPSSWNRPQFDAGSAVINPPECQNNNAFWEFGSSSFLNVNWIELIHYHWTSSQANGSCYSNEFMVFASQNASHIHLSNWYAHAWTIASGADDIDHLFMEGCETCSVDYLVADNSDGTVHTGIGMQWPTQHSIFKNVANALKPNMSGEFAYNDISNVQAYVGGVHPNCIESIGPIRGSGTLYIHDNRVHDNGTCEGLQVGNPGETDYVWNNLWYNNTTNGANGPNLPQNNNNAVAMYFFNNTNVDQRNYCIASDAPGNFWSTAFVVVNNHCITSGNPSGTSQSGNLMNYTVSGAKTILFANNIVESLASANSNGYSKSQGYVYSPTSGSGETVGAGQNLTSTYWPAGFANNDTTYACTEQTVSGVVQSVCPARPGNNRPSTGAWDVGVYLFGSSAGQPNPPTGLAALVQ
jgi:hypothetical protein